MDNKKELIIELLRILIKENILEDEKVIKEIEEKVLDAIRNILNYKEIIK